MVFAVKVSKFRILNLQNSRILTLIWESIYRLTFHLAKNHTSSLHHSTVNNQLSPVPFVGTVLWRKKQKKKSQPFGRCSHANPNPSVPKNVSYITLLTLYTVELRVFDAYSSGHPCWRPITVIVSPACASPEAERTVSIKSRSLN